MRNRTSRDQLTSPKDELNGDELNAVMGGWLGQWINGGGTTTSGVGTGIRGESLERPHRNEIDIQ
jgi:hypothetical protein